MTAPGGKARVLVVEDERSIRQGLCEVLTYRGYAVGAAASGSEALSLISAEAFDLVLLDVMLPEIDGFTLCERLRKEGHELPILMLTAKNAEDDVLRGFEAGADDYVTKPFGVRELLARVQALLKRSARASSEHFQVGPFDVNPERSSASTGSLEVELSAKELQILRVLAEDPGRIISRRTLLREVWGMSNVNNIETRTVDMHIAKLRKKLGDDQARLVETVRGQGYRLCASDR